MAVGGTINEYTVEASGNAMSAAVDQFQFVRATTSNRCLPGGAGSVTIGVQQNRPKNGEGCAIAPPGSVTKLRLGGTVSANDPLKSDGSGDAVRSLGDAPTGAVALEDGVDGDVIRALVVISVAASA